MRAPLYSRASYLWRHAATHCETGNMWFWQLRWTRKTIQDDLFLRVVFGRFRNTIRCPSVEHIGPLYWKDCPSGLVPTIHLLQSSMIKEGQRAPFQSSRARAKTLGEDPRMMQDRRQPVAVEPAYR